MPTDVNDEPELTDEDLDAQIEGEEEDEAGEDDESPDAEATTEQPLWWSINLGGGFGSLHFWGTP